MGVILVVNDAGPAAYTDAPSFPDYPCGALQPRAFRNLMLGRGAVMLRGAADPQLLDTLR